jgi:uncharacterized protein YndB with AHSA1/START domain
MRSTDRIEKKVTLRAPVARVWRAIADAQEFGRWFGFTLDGPFLEGRKMTGTFNWKIDEGSLMAQQQAMGLTPSRVKLPDRTATLFTIERIEPERYFSFRWVPYGIDADADADNEPTTLVEFRLEPSGEGTALTIVESGFDRIPEHRRARAFGMNEGGWNAQEGNLRKYVEGE